MSTVYATTQAAHLKNDYLEMDLELVRMVRGVTVQPGKAWRLGAVRRWFEEHQGEAGNSPYCLCSDGQDFYEDWYTTACGHYVANDDLARRALYEHVVACYDLGVPLVMLARQATRYPLYFDLDLYGGLQEALDEVHQIAWVDDEKLLVTLIVRALQEVYPQFWDGLEVVVFCSSGFCQSRGRYKASYHLVFPDIIVDRPVKCWPDGETLCDRPLPARHAVVRNHVVCQLSEASASGSGKGLHEDLLRCCDWERVDLLEEGDDPQDTTYLNDWTEVLDERPLWHEPWPEAATGLRLPFTDKPHEGCPEGRPKVPLGRWQFGRSGPLRQLPDLQPVEWVRLGDISACASCELTPWDEAAIHEAVWAECRCPDCA